MVAPPETLHVSHNHVVGDGASDIPSRLGEGLGEGMSAPDPPDETNPPAADSLSRHPQASQP